LDELGELIDAAEHEPKPGALAGALGVRRSRLARAYRRWRGEGLETALRSRRVAAAAVLIEATDEPLAQIAAGAGFCDQSHMNRCFRQLLGRTPATLRTRRLGFAGGVQSAAA
jgi:AraC family transcriptional regulator